MKKMNPNTKVCMVNMCNSLIEHTKIKTTLSKAKKLRPFIERQITKAKIYNLANYRLLLARLKNKKTTRMLFDNIAPNTLSNTGGYTSIIKCDHRFGDCAPMAYIIINLKNKK